LVGGIRGTATEGVFFTTAHKYPQNMRTITGAGVQPRAVLGMCESGCKVGYFTDANGKRRAAYVEAGDAVTAIQDLHALLPVGLGAVSSEAYAALGGINDPDKTVVGAFTDQWGFRRAFKINAAALAGGAGWGQQVVELGVKNEGASA